MTHKAFLSRSLLPCRWKCYLHRSSRAANTISSLPPSGWRAWRGSVWSEQAQPFLYHCNYFFKYNVRHSLYLTFTLSRAHSFLFLTFSPPISFFILFSLTPHLLFTHSFAHFFSFPFFFPFLQRWWEPAEHWSSGVLSCCAVQGILCGCRPHFYHRTH